MDDIAWGLLGIIILIVVVVFLIKLVIDNFGIVLITILICGIPLLVSFLVRRRREKKERETKEKIKQDEQERKQKEQEQRRIAAEKEEKRRKKSRKIPPPLFCPMCNQKIIEGQETCTNCGKKTCFLQSVTGN